MPHSVTPEATSADESSRTVTQVDNIKSEPEIQDVSMDDAPSPAAAERPKVSLEELFDDEDSDEEFASSAPAVKSEEESSQPAPLYLQAVPPPYPEADNLQQDLVQIFLLRP
jgi:DNA primase small subunit